MNELLVKVLPMDSGGWLQNIVRNFEMHLCSRVDKIRMIAKQTIDFRL